MQERIESSASEGREQGEQYTVNGSFAGPAESQARQRDAGLGDGQQSRWIGQQIERGLRPGLPLFGHRAQTASAHGDESYFRAGKKAVQGDDGDQEEKTVVHRGAGASDVRDQEADGGSNPRVR